MRVENGLVLWRHISYTFCVGDTSTKLCSKWTLWEVKRDNFQDERLKSGTRNARARRVLRRKAVQRWRAGFLQLSRRVYRSTCTNCLSLGGETFLAWVCSWKSKHWDGVLETYIVQPLSIVSVSVCRDLLVGWLAGPEAVNPSQPSRDTTVGPSASQHHPLQQDGLSLVHKTFVRIIAN